MNKESKSLGLISPWRIRFQWLTSLVILLLPWLQVSGESAFRVDVTRLTFYLFGSVLRIEELYLFLIFLLLVILIFFLSTMLFGRLWCGWACPQTTLSDMAEWLAVRFGCRVSVAGIEGSWLQKGGWYLSITALSLLIGSNLVWYFIEPLRFFQLVMVFKLPGPATILLILSAAIVYLDLTYLRRLFCKEFCPYGRFQSALADDTTLVLHQPASEKDRCIDCGACVHVCPMGIDIRNGYQIECINCGRCSDACKQVMAVQGDPGLIHYHFGTKGGSLKGLVHRRSLTLSGVVILLSIILVVGVATRRDASIRVAHSHTAASRILADGSRVIFFNGWLTNHTSFNHVYDVTVEDVTLDLPLELKGTVARVELAGGKNVKIDFALVSPQSDVKRIIRFELLQDDEVVAKATAQLFPETR